MRDWMVTAALLLVAWIGGLGTAVVLDTFRDHGSAQTVSESSREPGSGPPVFPCGTAIGAYEEAAGTLGVTYEQLDLLHAEVIDVCLD